MADIDLETDDVTVEEGEVFFPESTKPAYRMTLELTFVSVASSTVT